MEVFCQMTMVVIIFFIHVFIYFRQMSKLMGHSDSSERALGNLPTLVVLREQGDVGLSIRQNAAHGPTLSICFTEKQT